MADNHPDEDGHEVKNVAGDETISFLCQPGLEQHLPPPQPASHFIPEWFRSLEREMGIKDAHGLPGLTVKACLPVTDAFSLGWIIPLATDVNVAIDETGFGIQASCSADAPFQPLIQHHPGQIGAPNPPFEHAMPMKWINPWRIIVPEGYSVLFSHPLNHCHLPFQCFSGFVDCDQLATTVNFPFAWNTKLPANITLERGTPLIQLIPIRRDTLLQQGNVRTSSENEWAEQQQTDHKKNTQESIYRREWRVKK